MMRKKVLFFLIVACCLLTGMSVCANGEEAFQVEEYTAVLPGLEKEYTLLFMADMHILLESDEVGEEYLETVGQREDLFVDPMGTPSAKLWIKMAGELDDFGADAVLLGGDMVDFASEATLDCLKEGLDLIKTPVMYVRADHDYGVWYQTMEKEQAREKQREVAKSATVYSMDLGEFLIVGINNNTSQLSKSALEKVKKLFQKGKPVILMMHVPLESHLDNQLEELSKEAWQDRALLWGEDTYYKPDENTRAFLEFVYADDSPVREILCGHLHFQYSGYLTDSLHEYVAGPAYAGEIALIHVQGGSAG